MALKIKHLNSRNLTYSLSAMLLAGLVSCGESTSKKQEAVQDETETTTESLTSAHNTLSEQEKQDGWELLWDGKTTDGWRGARMEEFPDDGWDIENGELIVPDTGGGESAAGGDIITKEKFDDFELKVDFKITDGSANSGIKYFVDPSINQGPGSSIGLEYQILGSEHPEYEDGGSQPGSLKMASLYELIEANPIPVNPVGEWNTALIKSNGNHVEHWLNGTMVLDYERKTEGFRELVAQSKYDVWENFGELDSGHILLQDHGDHVVFRNIKIKRL